MIDRSEESYWLFSHGQVRQTSAQTFVQRPDLSRFRPNHRNRDYGENRSVPAADYGQDRSEKRGSESWFKRAEFIRSADKNIIHSRNESAHFIGCDQLHDRAADNHAHTVKGAGNKKHAEGKPQHFRYAENDGGNSETGHAPKQGFAGMFHRREVSHSERRDKRAHRGRGPHPTETDRTAM